MGTVYMLKSGHSILKLLEKTERLEGYTGTDEAFSSEEVERRCVHKMELEGQHD